MQINISFKFIVLLWGIANALPTEECTKGQTFWCSSLKNAKLCNAVNHCRMAVWSQEKLTKDSSDVCQFCESLISDAYQYITANKTEKSIGKFLSLACNLLPYTSSKTECKETIEKYLQDLITLIRQKMDSKAICQLIKACDSSIGFKDVIERKWIKINVIPIVPIRDNTLRFEPMKKEENKVLSLSSNVVCQDCLKFIGDLKESLIDPDAQKNYINFVKNSICNKLPVLQDECIKDSEKWITAIAKHFESSWKPADCCGPFCASNGVNSMSSDNHQLFALAVQKITAVWAAKVMNPDECNLCKVVLKEIKETFQDANVQNLIKKLVKKEICPIVPFTNNQCETMVDQYATFIFEFLSNELDSDTRCKSFGLCLDGGKMNNQQLTASFLNFGSVLLLPENNLPIISKMVGAEETKIDNSVKNIKFSGSSIYENNQIVSISKVSGKSQVNSPVHGPSAQCVVCEFLIKELKTMIGDNKTEDQIILSLEKVCAHFPSSIAGECQGLVELYGRAILELLLSDLDPQDICATIGLCDKRIASNKDNKPITEDYKCEICEIALQYAESLLDQSAGSVEIQHVLDKVCYFTPESMKSPCLNLVNEFQALIVHFIATSLTPKEICQEIKICSISKDVILEQKSTTFSPKKRLYQKCIAGPSYWCASQANAELCEAVDHCRKYIWSI